MSVNITAIMPQDALATSRLTINSNEAALAAGINALQGLLDPSTSILSGVVSASIVNNTVPFSTSIFNVNAGSSLLGNVIMGTIGASTSVLINGNGGVLLSKSSLTITNGNLSLSSATSLATFSGHLSIAQEFRVPGLATAFSSIIGLTASTTIAVAGLKYLVISNNSTTSGLTASLSSGTLGQTVEIFHALGASGYPVYINALNFSGLTASINLTQSFDTLTCIFDGASWYVMNYSAASFATGGTISSITFTPTI